MLGTIECTWLMVFAVTGKKLQDIVDHLHGAPHAAALEMKITPLSMVSQFIKSPLVTDPKE